MITKKITIFVNMFHSDQIKTLLATNSKLDKSSLSQDTPSFQISSYGEAHKLAVPDVRA